MVKHKSRGQELRVSAKELILDFMRSNAYCSRENKGIRAAEFFRECGLDWGDHEGATSSNQQYWLVALLRDLEKESALFRDSEKLWHLK